MKKRTSTSYVCTLDVNSACDMERLETIKQMVKTMNQDTTLKYKKRVCLRGRKPRCKQKIYSQGKIYNRSYDLAGNIVGGIKNATMIDVYIYDRT